MTAYNGMWRCEGSKRKPVKRTAWKGICSSCGRMLKVYPTTGCMVLHKRKRQ